jgi:hypothetical protein
MARDRWAMPNLTPRRCTAVPQRVRRDALGDPGGLGGGADPAAQRSGCPDRRLVTRQSCRADSGSGRSASRADSQSVAANRCAGSTAKCAVPSSCSRR